MASFFSNFDHVSKAQSHVQAKTASGGLLSLVALLIMAALFVSELVYWRTTRVEDHIVVDKSLGDRDVDIDLDMHFHALACSGAWGGAGRRRGRGPAAPLGEQDAMDEGGHDDDQQEL
jgi:hypothetical protein